MGTSMDKESLNSKPQTLNPFMDKESAIWTTQERPFDLHGGGGGGVRKMGVPFFGGVPVYL